MKKIALLLANGFEALEASVFTDVFGWSRVVGSEPIDLVTVARHEKLKCTWNFTVIPELLLKHLKVCDYDALAIPGGFQKAGFYEDAYHPEFLNCIQEFNKHQKIIAAICVGALALGKSGILNNRKATTYHLVNGMRKKQLKNMGADVQDAHVVRDGNLITSSSPATGLKVAFLLLECLTSQKNVAIVKQEMGCKCEDEIV